MHINVDIKQERLLNGSRYAYHVILFLRMKRIIGNRLPNSLFRIWREKERERAQLHVANY